ncbi:MAG TPA: hypothetical protein VHA37_09750 [Candidatus Saccharimonadales bacterium]|nr:hypothetical protein [Candidatus Saccharimonadales bacterium]
MSTNHLTHSRAWKPSISLIIAVLIIAGAVAFAVWQSDRNTVTGNTVETRTANMQVSRDGVTFSNSVAGHDYSGVVPGSGSGSPSGGYPVYIKNTGDLPLSLKWSVSSVPTSTGGVNLNKVHVLITPVGGSTQSYTMQGLIDAASTGGLAITGNPIGSGAMEEYNIQIAMDADAFNGANASIGNLDFAFIGAYVNPS